MPTAGDQVPGGTTDLSRRVQALEKEVRELRAARRLETATVGKGGLRVVDGGRFAMDTPSGVRMVDIGALTGSAYNHSDGTLQQGMRLSREDGSLMFAAFSYPPTGFEFQAWTWYDRSGNTIFAEDTNSGQGLARPVLPVQLQPAYGGGWDQWPRNTTTTMADLWAGRIYRQQPRIVVVVRASMDVSGATGYLELRLNNTPQGTPTPVGFGVTYYTLGPYLLPGNHMEQIDVAVWGRRDTGTGALRATIHSAYTTGS
ncbi:hypothetical protein [Streptomyces sp. SCSIO ZS0520]|uniref:hypothetical protein n=1 Tax=Streptomyces sp. SCSIO ZS0520 TaxID=2892996 RepID=UPI0021DA7184|nr:hypothetical protein [Streptomyces sp. SCSIO ZS0520]